jgi:transglutaminase-like putative cysteine protease
VPRPSSGAEQREIKLIAREPDPLFDEFDGFTLFSFEDIYPGAEHKIQQSYMITVYEVQTKINTGRVPARYQTDSDLYRRFTDSTGMIPSSDPTIAKTAASVTAKDRHPHSKAWRLYQYVLGRLSFDNAAAERDIAGALTSRKGDAYTYAMLYTSLMRAAGVPCRPVAGYLVPDQGTGIRHYWAEYYLIGLGWIPVDPALGDGAKIDGVSPQVNPGSYYFGNSDNQRIAFSHGVAAIQPIDSRGSVVARFDTPALQTVAEEYSGGLRSHTANWSALEVLGVY